MKGGGSRDIEICKFGILRNKIPKHGIWKIGILPNWHPRKILAHRHVYFQFSILVINYELYDGSRLNRTVGTNVDRKLRVATKACDCILFYFARRSLQIQLT